MIDSNCCINDTLIVCSGTKYQEIGIKCHNSEDSLDNKWAISKDKNTTEKIKKDRESTKI